MTSVNHVEPDLAKTYLREAVRLCGDRRLHLIAIRHAEVLMEDFSTGRIKIFVEKREVEQM